MHKQNIQFKINYSRVYLMKIKVRITLKIYFIDQLPFDKAILILIRTNRKTFNII